MPLLEEEYRKEEKINGVIYDMSPSCLLYTSDAADA